MKIKLIILAFICSSVTNNNYHKGRATYYDTSKHKKVHRDVPTAAYCDKQFKGMELLVTYLNNNQTDTVLITDVHAMGPNHIDLSHLAFDRLTKLDTIEDDYKRLVERKKLGNIPVSFKLLK